MEGDLLRFGLTALVTLLVLVDPFGLVPIFVTLTAGCSKKERAALLGRAVRVAFGVSVLFLAAGRVVLAYLGVTVNAFAISGGVLLFAAALQMLFGQRTGLQSSEPREGSPGDDISVFPLAIPLLSGPGTLTAILLLTSQARGNPWRVAILFAALVVVFVTTWIVLRAGELLMERIGEGGAHVATRVMGIVLAALAVQFVLNGTTGYYQSLSRGN
jgi:multiple antibiotic resistance protein